MAVTLAQRAAISERQRQRHARRTEADANAHPVASARVARALTQRQVAAAADLHLTTVCGVECYSTRPTARTLRKLAKALKVKPEDLVPSV